MPVRRPLLALALASALTGCVSAPPNGPIALYSPGAQPVSGKVPCDANYALVARDENGPRDAFGEHHLRRGDRVGFRVETDGSVTAVAPGYSLTLPAGSYAWEVVAASAPTERDLLRCDARRHALTAAKVAGVVCVGALAIIPVLVVIAFASSSGGYL
ncbi:hypothetical protein [Gemmata sp.]|uniref:hypothetical protein n=1 Tax=Gemmata sp. TaxID=1914242 RepID=UPI003F7298F1